MRRIWPGFPVTAGVAATAAGVLVLFARSALLHSGPEAGLPLDDGWIHLRFAMNLAAGEGLSFNPGEASAGATAPLWVVALAALQGLPGEMVRNAALLSAVGYAGACALTAVLAFLLVTRVQGESSAFLRGGAALAAGSAAALSGRFAWSGLSGMEVGLAAALQILSMVVFLQGGPEASIRRGVAAAALAGLAVLARPEALLLLLLMLGLAAWDHLRRGQLRHLLLMTAAGLAPILPWAIYCTWLIGRPLPATFQPNQGGLGFPDTGYLAAGAWQLFMDNPAAAVLALAGAGGLIAVVARCREVRLLLPVLWMLAFPLAASTVAPNLRHHGRYTMPLIPVAAALAAVGALVLAQVVVGALRQSRGKPQALAGATLLVVLVAGPLPALSRWVAIFGRDVQNIQHQHVEVGRWLAEQGEPDCHVATHDIGAIAVISGCHVTDLIGLVSPRMARLYVDLPDPRLRDPEIRRILGETGVTHVAIYPNWFPSLSRDAALTQVHAARLGVLSSAGAPLMVVYRTPGPGPW